MSGATENASEYVWVPKASAIAKEAGARLREFLAQGVETEYKGDVDLVTVADRTVEKLIRGRLGEAFPEHGIYGEEGTRERLEGEFRWYVDPLDGTTNFTHGFPQFCVSLGLEHRQVQRQVQRPAGIRPDQDGTLVATGFPSRKRHDNPNIHFYQEFTLRSHGVRRAGSAALDLAYVASGRMDAFWEFKLNPWDTAAGILLVEEAGGRVTDFSGGHFRLDSREILASNGLIHEELLGLFSDMFAGRGLTPIPTPQEYAAHRAARTAVAG